MRIVFALAVLLSGSLATAQVAPKRTEVPAEIVRFGVPLKLRTYPQDTAKKALASAVEAADRVDIAYLVAHLLDPAFVESRIADRAKSYEADTELELARLRDHQLANRDTVRPEDRIPNDREGFNAVVISRSRDRAALQLVRDVEEKLLNDPQSLKDMKKLLRDGTVTDDAAGGAQVAHPDVKERALYFKKVGDRWFLENRQRELPMKNPEVKKDPGM